MATQKGIVTRYKNSLDGVGREVARCPFCDNETVGIYTRYEGGEWLETESYCCHFQGFASGGGFVTVAHFEGFAEQLRLMEAM